MIDDVSNGLEAGACASAFFSGCCTMKDVSRKVNYMKFELIYDSNHKYIYLRLRNVGDSVALGFL